MWKRLSTGVLMVLLSLLVSTGYAQSPITSRTLSSGTCTGASTDTGCWVVGTAGSGGLGVTITGTFSGTVTFKATVANTKDCSDTTSFKAILATPIGSTTPVSTATAPGSWAVPVGGMSYFCAVFTNYISGSAAISMRTAPTTARMNGGGGGGGSVVGGTCTNQFTRAIDGSAIPTCATVTTTDTDNTIAKTGVDINTSNQVVATHLTSPEPTAQGGTGAALTPVVGDILYASSTSAFARLAAVATGNALISAGTGTAPAWGKISLTAAVSGILPTANGGTGIAYFTAAGPTVARVYTFPDAATTVLTTNALVTVPQGGTAAASFNAHGVLVGQGTSAITSTGAGTSGQVLTSQGSSADPIWVTVSGTGTLTSVATTSPITGGTITTTGTIACGTCVTAASALSAHGVVVGAGSQATVITATGSAGQTFISNGASADPTWQTLTFATFGSQSANCIVAAPDGSSGNLTCRTMVSGDLPQVTTETAITTGTTLTTYGGAYEVTLGSPATVFLPTTAGHAGAGAAFRVTSGSSNLTLDGNGSQQICNSDSCATTQVVVANQSVNLIVDRAGAYWQVVSGEKASTGGGGGGAVSETAITTTSTLAYASPAGRKSYNVTCTCTLNLPAVSGHTGEQFSIRLLPGSGIVTLDANGSELIGGALTRILWADATDGEAVVIQNDGTGWQKVERVKKLMRARLSTVTAAQTIASNTITVVTLDVSDVDSTGTMVDTTNHRIIVKRPGVYFTTGAVTWIGGSSSCLRCQTFITVNGTIDNLQGEVYTASQAAFFTSPISGRTGTLGVSDYIDLEVHAGANSTDLYSATSRPGRVNFLEIVELDPW